MRTPLCASKFNGGSSFLRQHWNHNQPYGRSTDRDSQPGTHGSFPDRHSVYIYSPQCDRSPGNTVDAATGQQTALT
jgi:hypothetical protein